MFPGCSSISLPSWRRWTLRPKLPMRLSASVVSLMVSISCIFLFCGIGLSRRIRGNGRWISGVGKLIPAVICYITWNFCWRIWNLKPLLETKSILLFNSQHTYTTTTAFTQHQQTWTLRRISPLLSPYTLLTGFNHGRYVKERSNWQNTTAGILNWRAEGASWKNGPRQMLLFELFLLLSSKF